MSGGNKTRRASVPIAIREAEREKKLQTSIWENVTQRNEEIPGLGLAGPNPGISD
jgi:hypothetical protein